MINQVCIVSGKGGTGKTSLTASFAVLAEDAVLVDCDVDAADLHLLLQPEVHGRHEFYSGHCALIRSEACIRCGTCASLCRFGAIAENPERGFVVDPAACEGCGVCVRFCPEGAIEFPERYSGQWMISTTRCGTMVHARLGIAAENSGKLVSTIRREASRIAEQSARNLIIIDGPPGIGCPVIASVVGTSVVLAVTEPTLSGEHDLERILALTRHFGIPAAVCVNKWDINSDIAERIEQKATDLGAHAVGKIGYESAVTKAQLTGVTAVEIDAPVRGEITRVWDRLRSLGGTYGIR